MEEYTKLSIHNHFKNKSADLTIDRPIDSVTKFDLQAGYDQIREAKTPIINCSPKQIQTI